MNTAVTKHTQTGEVAKADRVEANIALMADKFRPLLKSDEDTDRFCRVAINAVQQTRDMNVVVQTPEGRDSIYTACLQAASDRLLLDKKQAALVVYNENVGTRDKPQWVKTAKYMPMVQGLIHLAYDGGVVKRLICQVVHAADGFGVSPSSTPPFVHNFPEDPFAKRGDIRGVYAVAQFHDGSWSDIEVMSVEQVEGVRKRSKTADSGPWKTDWSEMARKTAIRRLSKYLPKTGAEHFHSAVQRLDADYDMVSPIASEGPKRKEMVAAKALAAPAPAPSPAPAQEKRQAAPVEAKEEAKPEVKKGAAAKQEERQKATNQAADKAQSKPAAKKPAPVEDDDMAGFEERDVATDAEWDEDGDV